MAEKGRQPVGRDGLTIKQRKWLKVYIKTGNATEAAMQVYDCQSREDAGSLGAQNVQKLRANIQEAMEEMGLTIPYLLGKLREGTDAHMTEVAKYEGKIMDEKSYVDFPTRHRYLDTAAKLLGAYAAQKHEIAGSEAAPLQIVLRRKPEQPRVEEPDGDTDANDGS